MSQRQSSNESTARPIIRIPVQNLLFDAENLRLELSKNGDRQQDLLKVLWTEMAVDEVALSIAANGYFEEEPLFAIPENAKEKAEKRYIVVEGNRRLAAVLLLRDDNLRKKIGATDLPTLTGQAKAKLERLPVSIYGTREELWQFLGFRHINGPKPWAAFSKAKYVAEVHEKYGVDLPEIANTIGDRHSTVVRLYRGYKLLEQAESAAGFRREDIARNRFYFSHLYTAADQPEFQKFLGITAKESLKPNPVPGGPKGKIGELKELMLWLYGSRQDGIEPAVRKQSPDLNRLREVISSPRSLAALRGGYSLARSHEISVGDERRFRESLIRAKEELLQAKATVTTGYSGEADLYETIENIIKVAETIKSEMEERTKSPKRR